MEMDQTQPLILKEKLEFFDILKHALRIPFENPKFIIFTIITSLPFLCFSLFFHKFLLTSLIQTFHLLTESTRNNYQVHYLYVDGQLLPNETIESRKLLPSTIFQLIALYLVPYNLLEFLTMILTTDAASMIYTGENEKQVSLKEMVYRSLETRVVGPFLASMYVLFFSSCNLIGLAAIVINSYILSRWNLIANLFWSYDYYYYGSTRWSFTEVFIYIFHGVAFIALLVKYLEWRAGWNMALVISVIEEEADGAEALVLSGYYGRGSSRRGFWLMVVVFGWEVVFRLPCLLYGLGFGWSLVLNVLLGMGNVMKWVVFVVFSLDCKKRIMEKKVDDEIHV